MNMIKLSIIICVCLSATACVQNGIYYWGNYSQSQYKFIKSPSPETLRTHIENLNKIIKTSLTYGKRVPPGVYSELAIMINKEDPSADVNSYLDLEIQNYPESTLYIQFLKKNILSGKKEGNE